MRELKGVQRKYLRSLAHNMKPSAFVGQKGVTTALINEINEGLEANELIKIKFVDFKEKKIKAELAMEIAERSDSCLTGLIGHVAIYYRENRDVNKRNIVLPQ